MSGIPYVRDETAKVNMAAHAGNDVSIPPGNGRAQLGAILASGNPMEAQMQIKPKSNSVVTHQQMPDGALRINVLGAGVVDFYPSKASAECRERAETHGWLQRLVDAAAIAAAEYPREATPEQRAAIKKAHASAKLDAIVEVVGHYHTGTVDWRLVATGGSGDGGVLFTALCRLNPDATSAQVREFVSELTTGEKTALMVQDENVKAMIDTIRAERAPKDLDTSAILKKFNAKLVM